MEADFRVDSIFVDEELGEMFAKCYDNVYGEEFEKFLGSPDTEEGRQNALTILEDSNYSMTDELRNEFISTFGLEDFGQEIVDVEEEDDSYDDNDDEVVESFSIREALNKIDLYNDNKYDLLSLYESCTLNEKEKRELGKLLYDQADSSVIYDTLNKKYISELYNESVDEFEFDDEFNAYYDGFTSELTDKEKYLLLMSQDMGEYGDNSYDYDDYEDEVRRVETKAEKIAKAKGMKLDDYIDLLNKNFDYNLTNGSYKFNESNESKSIEESELKEDHKADTMTFAQWFDETQEHRDGDDEFYPFENYIKKFPNAEILRDATAEDIRDNAHRFYDLYDVDSVDREKAFHFASEELGLDYDVFYDAWLNDSPIPGTNLNEAKKKREPKFWGTIFSADVIKDYESGKLTFDNIEEWDTAHNGGRKPIPPFNTKEILDYYIANKSKSIKEDVKSIDDILDTLGGHTAFYEFLKDTIEAYPGIEDDIDEIVSVIWDEDMGIDEDELASAIEYIIDDVLNESKSIKEDYVEATPGDKDCFAFITTINKRTRETKRQRVEGSYGKIRGIIASKQRNETLYDFEGPYKNESKSIRESSYKKGDRVELDNGMTGTVTKDFDWKNEDQVSVEIDGTKEMRYPRSETLKDLRESDEETPHSKKEVERELKSITHNFTDKEGDLKCGFEEEKKFGVEILKQHYKIVEASGDDRREGTWYHISFAEPIKDKSTNEGYELLNDNKVEVYSDYNVAKARANELGLKEAEYGDIYRSNYSYCYWNESGDRNDDEQVIAYYAFEDGKPRPLTEAEREEVISRYEIGSFDN